MLHLNLYVRWDTEGLVTPLQLDSPHSPDSAVSISSLVALTDPFCNQFISHGWNCSLDIHPKVTDCKLQGPEGFSNLG